MIKIISNKVLYNNVRIIIRNNIMLFVKKEVK